MIARHRMDDEVDADSSEGRFETQSTSSDDQQTTQNQQVTSESQSAPILTQSAPMPASFIYALGRVEPRMPSMAVEREFAQATGRIDAANLTDREALHAVLTDRSNRYLVRQLCWVFVIQGLETYLLSPRDPADLDVLVNTVRSRPEPTDLDVVIGVQGPLAPPEVCNGLVVPIVVFDQLYSFDRDELLDAIPRPADILEDDDDRFRSAAGEVLDRVLQIADNAGGSNHHRALNYLAVRYPAIYARTAESHSDNASLTAVDVRRSRLSGVRNIVDVILTYTHRQTDVVDRYFVRVDITEEFPFLVTKLSPYYER